uniref:Uncharacterized protein n=1 Tax=Arundo donax TaxID=35708 RepID=A0A0A9CFV9_ARUDO
MLLQMLVEKLSIGSYMCSYWMGTSRFSWWVQTASSKATFCSSFLAWWFIYSFLSFFLLNVQY